MSDIDDTEDETDDSEASDLPKLASADTAEDSSSPSPAIFQTGDQGSTMNPTLATYLAGLSQSRQDLADAQQKANTNALISQIGRAGSTLAQSAYGNDKAIDTSSFDAYDKSAQQPVNQVLAQQKAQEAQVANQVANMKAIGAIKAGDATTPEARTLQGILAKISGLDPKDVANATPQQVPQLIKDYLYQKKFQEADATRKAGIEAKTDEQTKASAAKQSAQDEVEGTKVGKEINPYIASGRSTVGVAAKTSMSAQKLVQIMQDPDTTPQDMERAYRDMDAMTSPAGTTTTNAADKQSYQNISTLISGAIQFVTSGISPVDMPQVKTHMAATANKISQISQDIFDRNTGFVRIAHKQWVARNPDQWKEFVSQVAKSAPDNDSGASQGPAPKKILTDDQVNAYAKKYNMQPNDAKTYLGKHNYGFSG